MEMAIGKASTVRTAVEFGLPKAPAIADVHVFDPIRFPYGAGRVYTPPNGFA